MTKPEYPCVHFSELKPFDSGSPLSEEWDTYRKQVGRLIAEGNEQKFVLIKGNVIVGFFETMRDAHREGLKRFGVYSYLVRQILTYERVYKVSPLTTPLILTGIGSGTNEPTGPLPLAKSA